MQSVRDWNSVTQMNVEGSNRPLPQLKHRFVVMLPIELAERVRDMAERERRPLSTQIQVLVERALAQEPVAA